MTDMEMPFQNQFSGLGTAPALENIELGEEVPRTINPHDVNIEATRYLFFAGDVITPSQKRERTDLRTGGEYFGQGYKTLVRSRGLVRRCQLTPMELAYDFMSNDMVGDDVRLHVVTTVNHGGGPEGQLNGIQVYPGEEIEGIFAANRNNTSKGFVEIEQLRGVDYPEMRKMGLQEFVFPEWKEIMAGVKSLPFKNADLQAHLHSRYKATSDTSIQGIIDAMLASCDQYYVWGHNYLKTASMLVKTPVNQGHVFTYSELAEQLFEQLGIRREDLLTTDQDIADIVARASAGNVSSGDVATALNKLAENQALLTQFLVNQGQSPVVVKDTVPQATERQCGKPKANGEPCTRELKEHETMCWQHEGIEQV